MQMITKLELSKYTVMASRPDHGRGRTSCYKRR